MPRKTELITKTDLKRAYVKQGLTLEETAVALGVSMPSVVRYMARYNIPRRHQGARTSQEIAAITERDRKVVELHAEGWSMIKIADRFGISRQRVHTIIKRNG